MITAKAHCTGWVTARLCLSSSFYILYKFPTSVVYFSQQVTTNVYEDSMKKNIIMVLLVMISSQAYAAELITKNYKIYIVSHCEEHNVKCDDVTYIGVHKKIRKSIKLKGTTLHETCADEVAPCKFIGYIFKKGYITYKVYSSGLLEVQNKNKVLLSEKGKWK